MSSVLFLEKKLRADKLGMLYLSRIMKDAGHAVDMIQDDIDDADLYLSSHHIDFVMYSVVTGEHPWFVKRNKELKKKYKFIAVMGGPHFTFFPEQGLSDPDIDFVVQGPGESVILDIVENRATEKIIMGHIPDDVNAMPWPDRSILYKYEEFGTARMKRFIVSRDCSYNCSYCLNSAFHQLYRDERHKFFQRTLPDNMISEIKATKEEYGLELVYFNDDNLAADHNWLLEFCDRYKREVGLPFCGSISANSVNSRILEVMSSAGCSFLNIALESANPQTQKFLGRGFMTNQQIKDACDACKSFGIKVRLQNMIGLPLDDPLGDALETLRYNQMINPMDSWASIFQPYPKTELWNYCIEKGFINEDAKGKKFFEETCLNIPQAQKINRLCKWWFFMVRYQIPIELVAIVLELPLTGKQQNELQDLRWKTSANLLYGI